MLIKVSLFFLLLLPAQTLTRNFRALYYKSMGPSEIHKNSELLHENDLVRSYDKIPFVGSIKIGTQFLEEIPVRIYYKGDSIPCNNGIFEFFDSALYSHYDVAICLCCAPKKGIIKALEVPTKTPYVLFSLEKKESKNCYTWHITKRKGEGPFLLPEKAIVVVISADNVDTIESCKWSADRTPIPFPSIILKKNSKKHLQSDADKATLRALDTDTFHKKLTHNVQINNPKQSISLAQEINV